MSKALRIGKSYGFLILLLILGGCKSIGVPAASPTLFRLLPTVTPLLTLTPDAITQPGQQPFETEVNLHLTSQPDQTGKVRYLLYLPESYFRDSSTRWPLILYLHGSGEAGEDLNLQKLAGLPKLLEGKRDFPFVVASPQIAAPPTPGYSTGGYNMQTYLDMYGWAPHIRLLEGLLEFLLVNYRLDPHRVYLTGISLGGFGTWIYALQYPDRFAAIVPIAGGYRFEDYRLPETLCALKDLPVWAFHGDLDRTVPARLDQVLIDGLTACGGKPRFTQYPDIGHDAWTSAYSDEDLWEWLAAQAKQ